MMTAVRRCALLFQLVALAVGQPLYGAKSPVINLDKKGWASMQSDLANLWVVEYYADWCGHCKQFAPAFEKAAGSLAGVVRFGGVNADGPKSVLKEVGVSSYPTVKVYLPELETNPYTGKRARKALDYEGARTAKALLAFVQAAMPNLVVPVASAADHAALLATGAPHLADAPPDAHGARALLFSAKSETSLLLKSLALRLRGRLALGEAKGVELGAAEDAPMAALARAYGVTELPALIVVPAAAADGGAAAPLARYAGELKAEPLWAFLQAHAGAEPAPAPPGALARPLDGVLRPIDGAFYEAEVQGSESAWVLAFEKGSTDVGADDGADAAARVPALGRLASQLRGQAMLGLVNASEPGGAALAALFAVDEFPALRVLEYGAAAKAPARARAVADGAAARKVAGESLPAELVPLVQSADIDGLLSKALGTPDGAKAGALATCVLFSDKTAAPPLLRALALNFAGALQFAMVPGATPDALERFSLTKLPALLCLWTDGAVGADGRVGMQGSKYDDESGAFAFDAIGIYLSGLLQQVGGANWADRLASARAGRRADGADGADGARAGEAAAVVELTAANYDALCGEAAGVGLCAIALLDGERSEPARTARADQLRALDGLALRRRGDPSVRLVWLDATCHDNFPPALDVSDADLPTLVVVSPSKRRFAKLRGTFTVEGMSRFVAGVVAGRVATSPFDALPPLDPAVDCATTLRGAAKYAALDGGEEGEDDTVAEILAEEAERRRQLAAELAAERAADGGVAGASAAAAAAPSGKARDEMSELERLEADVEECSAHDLLCAARREKQLKALEKRRKLEERLAEIAAAKKAKKKKAKRKAAAA